MVEDQFANRVILVVDDEERMARFIRLNLEHDGFQVIEAFRGLQAIQALRDHMPDLVILDVMMPDLDGFGLLESVRSDPRLREIPVIIFTAGDLNETQRERLAEFSQTMLYKSSFKEEELLTSIEHVLKRLIPAASESK